MANLLVVHGPNLNLLGTREPDVYGSDTLDDINDRLRQQAEGAGHTLTAFQSNAEGALVDAIQGARGNTAFIIINPGAYGHTSIAIRDALLGAAVPFFEVHISNVYQREPFRRHSYLSDVAVGLITGLGASGYEYALAAAIQRIEE